jgi:hypothetical protein
MNDGLNLQELKQYYSNLESNEINLVVVKQLLEQLDRCLSCVKVYEDSASYADAAEQSLPDERATQL